LKFTVLTSKISGLSSKEFKGLAADDPDCEIDLNTFYWEILNDHGALQKEQDDYKVIQVIRKLDNALVPHNYLQIKQDVQDITYSEMERFLVFFADKNRD